MSDFQIELYIEAIDAKNIEKIKYLKKKYK